jgi:hypothetical protein
MISILLDLDYFCAPAFAALLYHVRAVSHECIGLDELA